MPKETIRNYYEILGIEKYSSIDVVKRAYKKLVKEYHPDVKKGKENENLYKDIVKAYTVLKDPQTKKEYDQSLKEQKENIFKFKFEFNSHDFFLSTDKILHKIKLFFKNITGNNKKINTNTEEVILDDEKYSVTEELLRMPLEELEDRLLYSDNKYVRINAAKAIGLKREKKSLPALETAITASDIELKKVIVWAIGNLKMKKSLNLLKILYNSSVDNVKIEALKAIYKICEGKGVFLFELLKEALKDKSENVRVKALELFVLTGKKFEYNEIENLLKSSSVKINELLDRLIKENRITNFSKGAV